MENYYILGVVVGKTKLDYCLMFQDKVLKQGEVINETLKIRLSFRALLKEFQFQNEQIIICAEHAGKYNYPLIYTCECEMHKLWLENPSRIKYYCSGLQPGKNYKLNPKQIAIYASRNISKMTMTHQPNPEVEHLKQVYDELNMLEADRAELQLQLFEQKNYMSEDVFDVHAKRLVVLIKGFEDAIITVQNEIKCIFAVNNLLSNQMELLTSIEAIDWNVALKMIVETDAFTRFENSRQFSSHIGIAPMHKVLKINQHSTPIQDKGIKTLLNEAVLSVLKRTDSELNKYYIRKVKEGKDEKVVINAIRVKLVARMFAVIKSNQKYQPVFLGDLQYVHH